MVREKRKRRSLVAMLALALLLQLFAGSAWAERRVALVIGNASYPQKALRNSVNDASDVAAALRRLGFDVLERKNRNADELRRDVADFQDKLGQGAVGLFYFAGHGVQAGRGLNYLLPVGVEYKRERDAELYGLEVGSVLRRMEESGTGLSVVILDACRDSPFPAEGRSAGSRGLGRMEAPSGALIAFATAPGSTADDNQDGRNGLYTQHLLAALEAPGLRLEDVFKRVRRNVETASRRRQSPEEISKLTSEEPFYFNAGGGAAIAAPTPNRRTRVTQRDEVGLAVTVSRSISKIVGEAGHVNVSITHNSIILLTGEVKDEAMKMAVQRAASAVDGARSVVNELEISAPSSLASRASDGLITSMVKASLIDQQTIPANAIMVVVERGSVYLMGAVTVRDGALASDVARQVRDVRKVVKMFEYISEQKE
ncbi:MAG: caspase family protein [Pseudomonadota bacterium]